MTRPPIVSDQEWRSARDALLDKEKRLTRAQDALAAERRRLPMVHVGRTYRFDGPDGTANLPAFRRRMGWDIPPEGRPQSAPYQWWRLHDEYAS
ncbi:DUF899 family protein [Nonomuraea wenchangensis]